MPATRTEMKHASRSTPNHRQASIQVRRPASEVVTLSSGEYSPPRKKMVPEKKSAKQRSKQKARAPLPPPSEIIEISSDDDEPPAKRSSGSMSLAERRVKELEEESKRWKEAALAAQAVSLAAQANLAQKDTPPSDVRLDQILSTMDEHVSCEICTMKMWHPYTLSCGHTFCKGCIQDWFSTALAQHMSAHPTYNPQLMVPIHFRTTLARQDLSAHARRQIMREVARLEENTAQPAYSCPTCRVGVRNKPAENFVVKHMVRTIAALQGESYPKEDPPRLLGQTVEGPWDGFFPFALPSL
ncbi:hypothetical protein BC628DRAFT_1408472 [Trametes gibbosa]|uniref:RING-type domain-containing protein n=1 Tax=Trametes gibbosa TaxID=160864 RepID=A0A6G6FQN3_9APHY|nr:hypothetical protein BC628DRAFT_1408472 [Trametes gibbosa]QIE48493.1 hypothetical protein [Trametes gibbosa]